jgi:hypothetical protein
MGQKLRLWVKFFAINLILTGDRTVARDAFAGRVGFRVYGLGFSGR